MKNIALIALAVSLLAMPATNIVAQVATAPVAPDAPAKPAPPQRPGDDLAEATAQVAMEAQRAGKDALNQAHGAYTYRLAAIIPRNNPSGGTLVIPKDDADLKSLANAEEDLNIMSHILDKVVTGPEGKSRRAMGIVVRSPFDSASAPRNLYIDGYGALFFVNVDYPLSAPPASAQPTEAREGPSSDWDEARRELYQPPQPSGAPKLPGFESKDFEMFGPGTPAEPYDADRVEQLQKSLISGLKNAGHIRALKSHDAVTVVVTGRGPSGKQKVTITRSSNHGTGGFGGGSGSSSVVGKMQETVPPGEIENRGNQMILRASKSDIESFQNDKLSYDEFRKKVTVLIY